MPQRDPFAELEQFLERMNRGFGGDLPGRGSVDVDLRDVDGEYVLVADLPGFETEAIDVTVDDRTVTLRAEREEAVDVDEERYVHRERSHSERRRRVRLPGDVDAADTTATYEDGVLTVRLPKRTADEGGHEIDVE